MLIFTICASNYLAKAEVLARSVRLHCTSAALALVMIERSIPEGCSDIISLFDHVILAEQVLASDWAHVFFKYDIIEASTAIKPAAFIALMDEFPDENSFMYLDPDMVVYGSIDAVQQALLCSQIVVTPHHLVDETSREATIDNIYRTLCCGVMNLGFLALSRSEEAQKFLNWRWFRCQDFCFIDFSRGLFVDQKWVDLAWGLFETTVLRHSGYNVANWNISQRPLTRQGDTIFAGEYPLVLFHFSGIDKGKDKRLLRKYDLSGISLDLRVSYLHLCRASSAAHLRWASWSYGCFHSGEPIASEARLACARNPDLLSNFSDPYSLSNESILEIGY